MQLQHALGVVTFKVFNDVKVNAEGFRSLYSNPPGTSRMNLVHAKPHIDKETSERLTQILRVVLKEYVDPESDAFGNGLCGVMGGRPSPSMEEFTQNVLRAAAISGPEKVAEKVTKWSRGEAFQYNHEALLNLRGQMGNEGFIRIKEGIEIEKMPSTGAEVVKKIPNWVVEQIGFGDLMGGIVMRIACEWKPVFIHRNEFEQFFSRHGGSAWWGPRRFPMAGNTVERICQSLAVTTGRPISWNFEWGNYQEDEVLTTVLSGSRARLEHNKWPSLSLTEEDLRAAWNFYVQRETVKNTLPEVERAIERLHRSQQALTLEDQAIELRIALETLFLSGAGGSRELSFRLALHAARYIGTDGADRRKWFDVARDAYSIGSQAVHGSRVEAAKEEQNRNTIKAGQKLCIEGIKKRMKEQCSPDWDKVILA